MSLKPLKLHRLDAQDTEPSTVKDVRTVQANADEWTRQVSTREIVDGTLLVGVEVESGSNRILHRLGREPDGFLVVWADGAVTLTPSSKDDEALNLDASAGAVVSLWVF